MPVQPVGRPEGDEFPAYAVRYIDLVPDADVVATLTTQADATGALLAGVDDAWAGSYAYAPGKWTLKQVVGHLSDTERVFAYRALSLARGEAADLPGYDQDAYVASGDFGARTLAALSEELAVVRQATLAMLRGLPPPAWSRRGRASGYDVSVRGLVFIIAGHELHHVRIMRERYLRTGGR